MTPDEVKDCETENVEFEAKRDKIAAKNFYTIRARFCDRYNIKGDFGDEDLIRMIFDKLPIEFIGERKIWF